MERLTVALFRNRSSAEQIGGRLAQAGVDVKLAEETGRQRLWFVRRAEGGVNLEVMGDQLERAESLLLEWEAAEGALRDAIRCPQCQSLRVDYPQVARHSLLTNLIIGLATVVGVAEKDYYCEHCHFTWSRREQTQRKDSPQPPPSPPPAGETVLRSDAEDRREAA